MGLSYIIGATMYDIKARGTATHRRPHRRPGTLSYCLHSIKNMVKK